MSLKETIQADMKTALKAGEKERLSVIRMAFAALRQVEIDSRQDIDDTAALAVIEKLVKQRKESARQFRDAKRPELAEKEESEIDLLNTYLPEQLGADEVAALIDEIISTTGATSIKDMGKVMGQLKARAQGRVDMSAAGAIVRAKISYYPRPKDIRSLSAPIATPHTAIQPGTPPG